MRIKRFKTVLDDSNGHTGDTGAKIPVPSIWKSLYLSYPKAFLCTTFLYKDSKYALRNALFVLGSLCKVASVALLPVLALVLADHYEDCHVEHYDVALLFFTTAIMWTVAHIVFSRYVEFQQFSHITGPKPSFLYGNYKDLCKNGWGDRHHTLVDMHEKYGPVFRLHMPLVKRPFVYSNFVPNAIHNRHLDSLRPTKTLSPGSLMGIPLGDRHSKNFHHLSKIKSNTNFKQMLKDVDIVSKDLVQEMLKGEAASLNSMLLEWSLDAMFLYLYATHPDTSEKKQAIIAAVDMFTCEISHRTSEPMWMWFSSFSRVREWTTGFSYLLNLADEFYGKSASPLPNFMKAHGLEKWEAIDELTIFLAASFESTAHTVAQCLIMLSKDSERQDEAAKEAKKVLAEVGSGPILKEHTDQCMYIQHCVFQALRLHATVPFSARKMEHDYSIKDLNGMSATFIPAKSYLTYFKTAIGDNESIFPDAKVFEPERYEGMKTRTEKHMKFLPFGTGPLQCWGQVLAEMQMIQLLIRLLGNLDFSHTDIDSKSISIASVSVAAPGVDKVQLCRENKRSELTINGCGQYMRIVINLSQ